MMIAAAMTEQMMMGSISHPPDFTISSIYNTPTTQWRTITGQHANL
jgi:hypothetical protein